MREHGLRLRSLMGLRLPLGCICRPLQSRCYLILLYSLLYSRWAYHLLPLLPFRVRCGFAHIYNHPLRLS